MLLVSIHIKACDKFNISKQLFIFNRKQQINEVQMIWSLGVHPIQHPGDTSSSIRI